MHDPYYTPDELAELMMSCIASQSFSTIADFTAGEGALLKAATKRWANSTFIATDMNWSSVNFLKANYPLWKIGKCDFLDPDSRRACDVLENMEAKVSLVLLNSPFTCRGGTFRQVSIGDTIIRCGVALAFLLSSLEFLSQTGTVVAILPSGCLQTEKDEAAWKYIRSFYDVDIINQNKNNVFQGCVPQTVIARIQPKLYNLGNPTQSQCLNITKREVLNRGKVEITRGSVSMHSWKDRSDGHLFPFVHSTDLNGSFIDVTQRLISYHRLVRGPSVLIPRVGRPDKNKITLYTRDDAIVLSDCVMAFQCNSVETACELASCLKEQWHHVEALYGGTGAKYTTTKRLALLISELGFRMLIDDSSS